MKLRKGILGALLGVTFATILLSTGIVNAENNYTSTVGNIAVRTIRDDENMIGWKKINNQWYYLDSAGNYVKGWINVDGKQYYLKADGTRATNTIIGDYIFGNEGVGYQGKNENGKFYFADGWYYNFSDKKVYYPNHTSLKVGVDGKVYANERRVTFNSQGVFQSNWFKINRLWYSLNISGKALTGWQKIDDYWYYFNEFGALHIGWLKLNDNWYYFDKYTGIMHTYMMFTGTPIITTGETYYFDPKTGAMQTGWVTYESGDKYYFYSDGRMARNTKIGEYTINNYGHAYIENYTGWKKRYDDWTYSENGKMVTGWKAVNNVWYYFDESGVMKTGWQKIDGAWYYFANSGAMKTGWLDYAGKKYYLQSSGAMATNTTIGEYKINASGVATDQQLKDLNDTKYYAVNELKALTHIDANGYVTKVKNAQSIDEIQSIVNEAKAAETKAIEEANKPKPVSSNSILTNPEAKRTFILTFTHLLNEFRKENGLKEIYSTTLLSRAADIRSEDEKNGLISMYQNGQTTPDWNHSRPDGSGTGSAVGQASRELSAEAQIKNQSSTHNWINENIAINFQMPKRSKETPKVVAQRVFTQWKNSEGHRKNMLSPRAEVFGIGFWGDQSQSGPYIEFTFIGGDLYAGHKLSEIQLFQ
ncbi:CAP domain-containing protein [Enterococcus cecorum]|uniref:CAP domain-containing protein n=1 Tax=Enterococcus cecorum TaxID=44008 RepID=UPI003266F6B1